MAKRETKQAAPAATVAVQEPKMSFDVWWAMTQKKMTSGHHHKEIVLADFKARGLSMQESMANYNKALAQYGIKLK